MSDDLASLDGLDFYRRLFIDPVFWTPFVRQVCRWHRLLPCASIRSGLPGTYPTFIVDETWVVKFFGRLFEGGQSFEIERQAAGLLAELPGFPTPALEAQGCLLEDKLDWPWPYLIFRFVVGISLGEVYTRVSFEDRLYLAHDLGQWVRQMHKLPLPDASPTTSCTAMGQAATSCLAASWQPYLDFLNGQRAKCHANHRRWGSLPPNLVEQIDGFAAAAMDGYVPQGPPHLVHADLTRDHVLGRLEQGRWRSLALIDFGDAMVGDLYYELAVLQMDLFAGDRRLLAAFMDAYGWDGVERERFARRCLAVALMHQFDVFGGLASDFYRCCGIISLDQLADRLFGID